jgi:hypothetical protein
MKTASVAAVVEREAEVLERAQRRRFSGEYRVRILKEAEACVQPGQLAALLRKEGLYCCRAALLMAGWAGWLMAIIGSRRAHERDGHHRA